MDIEPLLMGNAYSFIMKNLKIVISKQQILKLLFTGSALVSSIMKDVSIFFLGPIYIHYVSDTPSFRIFLSHIDALLNCSIKGAEFRGQALIGK